MRTIADDIAALEDDFALLGDWEDRYAYVIDMGRALPDLPPADRTEQTRVRGCVSQVWLVTETDAEDATRLRFRGQSDSALVRGLVALMLRLFSGRTPAEILAVDPEAMLARLGLAEALTPQRSNGLKAMVQRIRAEARAHAPA